MPEKIVSKNDFINALKSKKKQLVESAKKKASVGITTDQEIIDRFKLSKTNSVTRPGYVSKVSWGWAKNDRTRPYVSFFYILDDGTPLPSVYRELFRTERSLDMVFGEFQRLGFDTSDWVDDPASHIVEAAEELTSNNPKVVIHLSVWGEKGDPRLNVSARLQQDEDEAILESASEEDFEEEEDSEEEDSEEEDSEEEDSEEEEEEESDDSAFDKDDPSTWVGYECEFKHKGKNARGFVTRYDEKSGSLWIQKEKGGTVSIDPEHVTKILSEDDE